MNLRNRLAVLSAATAALGTLLVSGVLLVAEGRGVDSRADAALVSAAAQADQLARSVKERAATSSKQPSLTTKPLSIGDVTLELLPSRGSVGDPTIAGPLTAQDVDAENQHRATAPSWRTVDGSTYRVLMTPLGSTVDGTVVAAWPRSAGTDAQRSLALRLAALVGAAALLAGLLGRLVAGRALAPIGRLTRTAEQITATGDLARRIEVTEADEVGRLSTTFNAMLASLEDSVAAQRQLVADASHELRTPLTSLRTNLDLLSEPPGLDDPDAPELVAQARRQTAELTDLVADLVSLARYGRAPQTIVDVRLDEVAASVAARHADRPDARRIDLDLEPAVVHGDEEALHRAVSNLVANAVAWSPPDGVVTIRQRAGRLDVIDAGPGIPEQDVPHVFERFYRAPAARSMPGSGLGLAIVSQVAEQHGGTVEVTSSPAGSTFTLRLPAGTAPDA